MMNTFIAVFVFLCLFALFVSVVLKMIDDEMKAREWMYHYQYQTDKQLMAWNLNLKRTGKRWYIHSRVNSDRRTEELSAVGMRKIIREMEESRPTEVFEKYKIPEVVKTKVRPIDDAPRIGEKAKAPKPIKSEVQP